MKPGYLAAAGVLLVAGAIGVIGLRDGSGHQTTTATGGDDPAVIRGSKTARQPRPGTGRASPELSSAEAVARLRNLLTQEPSSSHRFETVERWAGHLDDADLQELIAELGMEEDAGLTGWVRCALYAEWARRDPRVALARAEQLPDSGDHRKYAVEQVLFSVFRGWAESDPEAARTELGRLNLRIVHGYSRLENHIHRELARQDPEAAWKLFRCPPKAFFMGLDGKESVAHYLDRWDQEERWSSTEAQQKFADYKGAFRHVYKGALRYVEREAKKQGPTPFSMPLPPGAIALPGSEYVAAGAALALAEHDVEGAVTWLSTHGPGDDTDRQIRITTMLSEWASAHPAEALRLIEQDRLESYTGSLASAAIKGDPSIATAVMECINDHDERGSILQGSNAQANTDVLDFFPAPGLPNRLPNFQERYECLLEAVEAGNFQAGQKQDLLRFVYDNFRSKVPDAQQAYEAMKKEP